MISFMLDGFMADGFLLVRKSESPHKSGSLKYYPIKKMQPEKSFGLQSNVLLHKFIVRAFYKNAFFHLDHLLDHQAVLLQIILIKY